MGSNVRPALIKTGGNHHLGSEDFKFLSSYIANFKIRLAAAPVKREGDRVKTLDKVGSRFEVRVQANGEVFKEYFFGEDELIKAIHKYNELG